MTTGVTFYDWGGKPALIQDGQARAVFTIGGTWGGAAPEDGVAVASVRSTGLSIGRDEFDARFSAWGLADLDGWYRSRTSTAPNDTYAKARRFASA
jgi:hypothetical protein